MLPICTCLYTYKFGGFRHSRANIILFTSIGRVLFKTWTCYQIQEYFLACTAEVLNMTEVMDA